MSAAVVGVDPAAVREKAKEGNQHERAGASFMQSLPSGAVRRGASRAAADACGSFLGPQEGSEGERGSCDVELHFRCVVRGGMGLVEGDEGGR